MLDVRFAYNAQYTLSSNSFTMITHLFNRRSHFHGTRANKNKEGKKGHSIIFVLIYTRYVLWWAHTD